MRRDVFDAGEVGAIGGACEALVERLLEEKRNAKVDVGSYTFEIQRRLATVVKWEQENPDLLLGVELFAHLSEALRAWALDSRLVDPAQDIVASDEVACSPRS